MDDDARIVDLVSEVRAAKARADEAKQMYQVLHDRCSEARQASIQAFETYLAKRDALISAATGETFTSCNFTFDELVCSEKLVFPNASDRL